MLAAAAPPVESEITKGIRVKYIGAHTHTHKIEQKLRVVSMEHTHHEDVFFFYYKFNTAAAKKYIFAHFVKLNTRTSIEIS